MSNMCFLFGSDKFMFPFIYFWTNDHLCSSYRLNLTRSEIFLKIFIKAFAAMKMHLSCIRIMPILSKKITLSR